MTATSVYREKVFFAQIQMLAVAETTLESTDTTDLTSLRACGVLQSIGAMENKGLNIFNAKYVLAKEETATATD